MSKAKQIPNSRKIKSQPKKPVLAFGLSNTRQDILFLAILTIILIILLKPLVLDGLSPEGSDSIANRGAKHQIAEFKNETGETALWNPYVFSGMPIYHILGPETFSVDTLLNILGKLINSIFLYYLLAAAGMYTLLRYLKMSPLISFIATLIFILMPHYKSLYLEGHFAKFRAIMFVPWVFLSFLYFSDKRTLFTAALFALTFGCQIRTQHYQIIFYTGILILATGIYPLLQDLLQKNYRRFAQSCLFLFIAVFLGVMMAAQPLFLAKEYLPYSKRGKTSIDLSTSQAQPNMTSGDGVTMEYATQWSTHPTDLLTWIIPRFYGGMSGEKYEGNAVPQLRNRQVPGYWGTMPFTQSYEYMGVITLLLAILGIYAFRKKPLIISLFIVMVYYILLSFGQHFQSFYSLFYDYIPYFNKFRAPMMSVTITSFIISIFAAYGLKSLSELNLAQTLKEHRNILLICAGFLLLGVVIWIAGQSFTFIKAGETYEPQIQELVKKFRQEFFNDDLLRYFVLLILASLGILLYLTRRIKFVVLAITFALISLIDMASIHGRYQKEYSKSDLVEKQYFRLTTTDKFLNQDSEIHRIFPFDRLFGDNRWAYYHQTIGGYDPIKMVAIEELIENNLTTPIDGLTPINWNILKVLNAKYLITQQKIEHPALSLVQNDAAAGLNTYLFKDYLPRGYFTGEYKVIKDEREMLKFMNTTGFHPETVALLDEDIAAAISKPDSSSSHLTDFTPNASGYDVYTSQAALFVISECFYPPGWKISIDQKPVEKIYRTNHAMQSIIVPAGSHRIDLRFAPDSYYRNVRYAWIALLLIYVAIAVPGFKYAWSLFLRRSKSQ
jgi:hypothetical protein